MVLGEQNSLGEKEVIPYYVSNAVVPKLGAMTPGGHGAIAREPWAHIEKNNFSRIDTEIWTF